ncbi:MAG: hypothetical protein A2064_11360 [Spirochaetes bacterium GWB1_66_5]|nr:MAG: hypothetical protein A2064_11360 [Spirochaetes bacterium GWB1_66_5]
MDSANIAQARLANQLLGRDKKSTPGEVVDWLGAVQAQDFAAAKWAIGMRLHQATDAEVEKAYNAGQILRTHVMRPTWHFLSPQDIRAVQALTARRVRAGNASMLRKLELDGRLLSRCHRALAAALRDGQHLTRTELSSRLEAARIQARGQRLAYILMDAELEALICSGPRKGKQFTYALLEERVPKARPLSPEEALGRWARRYFLGHGPAQAKDFAWWSGLTLREAQRAIELSKGSLLRETISGNTYWRSPGGDGPEPDAGKPGGGGGALLLSIYDEYNIAYRDRGALGPERHLERLISMGNALTSVLILGGIIAGTWKRVLARAGVELAVSPFHTLRKAEKEAIRAAASAYGEFLGLPVTLHYAE